MKRVRRNLLLPSLALTLLALGPAGAATRNWDGGSTANSSWTTPENWEGNIAPAAGDDLVFSTGTRSPSNNNYPTGTTFRTLTMSLGGHRIEGNGVALNAGFSSLGGTVALASIKLNASQTFSAPSGGAGLVSSNIDTNGQTLTVDVAGTIQLNGVISGTGSLVKSGTGRLDLFGLSDNTFEGVTRVNNGLVQLFKSTFRYATSGNLIIGDAVGDANSAIVRLLDTEQIRGSATINIDGKLDLNGRSEFLTNLTLVGGNVVIGTGGLSVFGVLTATGGNISSDETGELEIAGSVKTNPSPGTVLISGPVNLSSATRVFDISAGESAFLPDLTINGPIREGGLTKIGAGLLRLEGANSYQGDTTVSAGELRINGEQPQSKVVVNGGTLSGVGTVGPVSVVSGTLAPSMGGAISVALNVQGNLQLSASAIYRFNTPSANSGGLVQGVADVVGAVDLGGATLEVVEQSAPGFEPGRNRLVIRNDGTDPIVGTFAGLPEGASFGQSGQTLVVSYRGGDGNDVVLYAQATRTWDGGGADDNWTTKANWVGDIAPQQFDKLEFPQDAAQKTSRNDYPAGTVFHSLTFTGEDYTLEGNPLSLSGGVLSNSSGIPGFVALEIALQNDQTFTAGDALGALNLRSIRLQGHVLTFDGPGTFIVRSQVFGPAGAFRLVAGGLGLFGGNIPAFPITVSGGTLTARSDYSNNPVELTGGKLHGFDNASKIGPVSATGGVVSPGTSFGFLAVAGDLSLAPGVVFRVAALSGNSAGSAVSRAAVSGVVRLGGSGLEVGVILNIKPGDTFIIIDNDGSDAVEGTFGGLAEGSLITVSGTSFVVSYVGGDGNDVTLTAVAPTPTPTATATPSPTTEPTTTPTPSVDPSASPSPTASPPGAATVLGNIATRLRVETGDNVLIGGLIISGSEPKRLIVRAIGPSLGVPGALQNPQLEIYRGDELIASNDNWPDAPNAQEIIDSSVAPPGGLESAVLVTLPPGAYTAVVSGVGGETGVGSVEAYDLGLGADSTFANIATRGFVQTGDDVMIGGLIVVGDTSQDVIVRALGPSLGIEGQLENPSVDLVDGNGESVAFNDDWKDTQQAAIEATTIPPTNDLESAIVATLPPGAYTAVVRGVDNTSGVALVEVYALD